MAVVGRHWVDHLCAMVAASVKPFGRSMKYPFGGVRTLELPTARVSVIASSRAEIVAMTFNQNKRRTNGPDLPVIEV